MNKFLAYLELVIKKLEDIRVEVSQTGKFEKYETLIELLATELTTATKVNRAEPTKADMQWDTDA